MARANQRQPGSLHDVRLDELQEAQVPGEVIDDHRQDRDAAGSVDRVPAGRAAGLAGGGEGHGAECRAKRSRRHPGAGRGVAPATSRAISGGVTRADAIASLRDLVGSSRSVVGFTGAGHLDRKRRARTSARPARPGCATSRSHSRPSSAASRRAARPGGASSPWTTSTGTRGPSRGHHALAALVADGKMPAVITQNIDGLHQASGVAGGEDRRAARQRDLRGLPVLRAAPRARPASGRASRRRASRPSCEACGGIVKSATISFGQTMPEEADAPRAGARARPATSSSRSARRSSSIRPRPSRPSRSATGRGSSSSTASRRTSTRWPTS